MTNGSIDKEPCLLCGAPGTLEHIIPQTLCCQFELDPNSDDLARTRTWLCVRHNRAGGRLHQRDEMMRLIANGSPVTRKTLTDLADWTVWVLLLLGLANGDGVLAPEQSRQLLRDE